MINASEQMADTVRWALQNPQSVFVFNELQKALHEYESSFFVAKLDQEVKELDKYHNDLCLQTSKDAGNLWIQFSDKWEDFKSKYLTTKLK